MGEVNPRGMLCSTRAAAGIAVVITASYGLDGPGFEPRWR
jgi:hypothetical protein